MKTLPLLLCLLAPAPARAARAVMEGTAASQNTVYVDTINVRVGVGTTTAKTTLDVAGNAQFGMGANKSTFTVTGALVMNGGSSITLSGAAGNIVAAASVTASAFFGNGAGVTGALGGTLGAASVTAGTFPSGVLLPVGGLSGMPIASSVLPSTVAYTSIDNNFSVPQTQQSTETIKGNAFSVGGSSFTVAGGSATVAYRLTPGSINMTGGGGTFTSQSSVTASAFFGDGSQLSNVGGGVSLAANNTFTGNNTFQSSVTINGGLFGTIDRSSQTVNVPNFSISSTTFGTCVLNSSVTYSFQGAGAAYGYVTATVGAASGDMGVVFLLDGAYAGGATSAKTTCGCVSSSLGICDVTCYLNLGQKATGSHTLCVSIAGTSGGAITWNAASTLVGNVVRLEQR